MIDIADLEGAAVEAYVRIGLDPSEPCATAKLARLVLRDPGVIVRGNLVGQIAATGWSMGAPKIMVRKSLPIEYAQHAIGHELAHFLLENEHACNDEIELACDYLGAALMCPLPAVMALYRAHGFDLSLVADEVVATQTWAALRLGEVLHIPLVVVANIIRVRGPEEQVWPAESVLRAWATARKPPRGLTRMKMTDQPKRVVLHAA